MRREVTCPSPRSWSCRNARKSALTGISAFDLRGCRLQSELLDDRPGQAPGRKGDRDDQRAFLGGGLLQRRELALQQRSRHEVVLARAQALSDETLVSFEVDQPDAASGADDAVAVGALQGRARDDALPAGSASLVDPPRDCLEP